MTFELRASTLALHDKVLTTATQTGSSRREIGTALSATITREKGHICQIPEEKMAAEKAVRRAWGIYIRHCISGFLDCKTWRGRTELVGASSHCGGCEGSHWSLTPTLCDDKIERIINRIIQLKGETTPRSKLYCKTVLGFEDKEFAQLKENGDAASITAFIKKHTKPGQWHRSYKGSSFENQANSTVENHALSNRVDSMMEKKLRSIEDQINADVFEKKLSPEEGTQKVLQSLEEYFTKSLAALKDRKGKIERFITLNQEIEKSIAQSVPDFDAFQKNVEELLALREEFKTKNSVIARFKKVDEYRHDYYTLRTLMKQPPEERPTFFQAARSQFKTAPIVDSASHIAQYDHMIQETEHQLKWTKLYNDRSLIDAFAVSFFGILEPGTNIRRKPTELEMQLQLIQMMGKEEAPPQTKTLKRKRIDFSADNDSPDRAMSEA